MIVSDNPTFSNLCLTNINMFWAGVIAETLARLGVKKAVISPGSRSAPITIAFGTNSKIETIPILDERSAAFFALGLAKQKEGPVVLVCTSGTAAANFYPAIIEARMSKVPLIVITADRPPEGRESGARQTIDQVKLYSDYPRFYKELALPEANLNLLRYLRQTIIHTCERSLYPQMGPVHLNVPFREPLAPITDEDFQSFLHRIDLNDFFSDVMPLAEEKVAYSLQNETALDEIIACKRGMIVVGPTQTHDGEAFSKAVGAIAQKLGWPVLADGLSPVRNFEKEIPNLITRYDIILRNEKAKNTLTPEGVLCLGPLPTCKVMRVWLESFDDKTWILEKSFDNVDMLHRKAAHLRGSAHDLLKSLGDFSQDESEYARSWSALESEADDLLKEEIGNCEYLFEGKVAWELSRHLPNDTPLFIANSMPVRDVEFFWERNNNHYKPYFSRGANGIDGTLSTALGIAHDNKPSILLTGDLSLLHDGNGFLSKNHFAGSLTIILINNNGGGIFEHLHVSEFEAIFEEYFATPQDMDFEKLAAYHGIDYLNPKDWDAFCSLICRLPKEGIRIIEVKTSRKHDVIYRRELFKKISKQLTV